MDEFERQLAKLDPQMCIELLELQIAVLRKQRDFQAPYQVARECAMDLLAAGARPPRNLRLTEDGRIAE